MYKYAYIHTRAHTHIQEITKSFIEALRADDNDTHHTYTHTYIHTYIHTQEMTKSFIEVLRADDNGKALSDRIKAAAEKGMKVRQVTS